jgi:hypothetical protein
MLPDHELVANVSVARFPCWRCGLVLVSVDTTLFL